MYLKTEVTTEAWDQLPLQVIQKPMMWTGNDPSHSDEVGRYILLVVWSFSSTLPGALSCNFQSRNSSAASLAGGKCFSQCLYLVFSIQDQCIAVLWPKVLIHWFQHLNKVWFWHSLCETVNHRWIKLTPVNLAPALNKFNIIKQAQGCALFGLQWEALQYVLDENQIH